MGPIFFEERDVFDNNFSEISVGDVIEYCCKKIPFKGITIATSVRKLSEDEMQNWILELGRSRSTKTSRENERFKSRSPDQTRRRRSKSRSRSASKSNRRIRSRSRREDARGRRKDSPSHSERRRSRQRSRDHNRKKYRSPHRRRYRSKGRRPRSRSSRDKDSNCRRSPVHDKNAQKKKTLRFMNALKEDKGEDSRNVQEVVGEKIPEITTTRESDVAKINGDEPQTFDLENEQEKMENDENLEENVEKEPAQEESVEKSMEEVVEEGKPEEPQEKSNYVVDLELSTEEVPEKSVEKIPDSPEKPQDEIVEEIPDSTPIEFDKPSFEEKISPAPQSYSVQKSRVFGKFRLRESSIDESAPGRSTATNSSSLFKKWQASRRSEEIMNIVNRVKIVRPGGASDGVKVDANETQENTSDNSKYIFIFTLIFLYTIFFIIIFQTTLLFYTTFSSLNFLHCFSTLNFLP